MYICEDSQPKLIPASVTEDDIINIESVAISINKMEDIIIKLRKTNSYLILAIKVHTLHSTCGKELFRNSITKQNVVTLNSCVHVLDNLILPTQRIGFFLLHEDKGNIIKYNKYVNRNKATRSKFQLDYRYRYIH